MNGVFMSNELSIEHLYEQAKENPHSDYLAEAVRCFNTKAYRACIIMTSNAVFSYMREYMQELGRSAGGEARLVTAAVNEAVSASKSYEGALLTALKEKDALSVDDRLSLREILDKRNTAAHPSGSSATRDDAYYVFKKAVEQFLGKKLQLPGIAVEQLLNDIEHKTFFVDFTLDDVARTVADAMRAIDASTYPRLLGKLRKAIETEGGNPESNSLIFLCGLARLDLPTVNSQIHRSFFERQRGFDPDGDAFLVDLCFAWPGFLSMTVGEQRYRLDDMFANAFEMFDELPMSSVVRSPVALLNSVIAEFGADGARAAFPKTTASVLGRFCDTAELAYLASTELKSDFVRSLLHLLNSGAPRVEPRVTSFLKSADHVLAKSLTRQEVEQLIRALMKAEFEGEALEMRKKAYSEIPHLRDIVAKPMPPITQSFRSKHRMPSYFILEGEEFIPARREYAIV